MSRRGGAAVTPVGCADVVAELPGYTRGLALHGGVAFVGLSRIRESNVFGGLEIARRREDLKCGVGAVELSSGRLLGHLEFKTGVEEIFGVEVLPGSAARRCPGPTPTPTAQTPSGTRRPCDGNDSLRGTTSSPSASPWVRIP